MSIYRLFEMSKFEPAKFIRQELHHRNISINSIYINNCIENSYYKAISC